MTVEHSTLGSVDRTIRENIFHGGKGINVSALLVSLGYRSTALGFIAGFTGREIEWRVGSLGFDSDFIRVEKGVFRMNVKLRSDQESGINGIGSETADGNVKQPLQKPSCLKGGDVLVLSGGIPAAIDNDIYQGIIECLNSRRIHMTVDAEKDLPQKILQYHPFLIKSGNHELGQVSDQELRIEKGIAPYTRKFKEQGAMNVLVSMAGGGAILVTEDDSVHHREVTREVVKNSVGTEDSMMVGFIVGYLEKRDYAYALKLEATCGGATVFSDDIGTKNETMRLLNTL